MKCTLPQGPFPLPLRGEWHQDLEVKKSSLSELAQVNDAGSYGAQGSGLRPAPPFGAAPAQDGQVRRRWEQDEAARGRGSI